MPRTGVNTRPPMTDAERAESVVLYTLGLSLLQVAAEVGRSYGAVHAAIYRAGIMRGKKDLPPGADERILRLWHEHHNITKIAEVTGHCRATVIASVERSGVTITTQRRNAVRDDERASMVRLYVDDHMTIDGVAAEVGRAPATVYRVLRKAGVVRTKAATVHDAQDRNETTQEEPMGTEQDESRARGEKVGRAAREQHAREEAARDRRRDNQNDSDAANWDIKPPEQ